MILVQPQLLGPGEVMRKHLAHHNLSQRELGEQIGVDHSMISKIVRGVRYPSMENFAELNHIFGPIFVLEYLEAINRSNHS